MAKQNITVRMPPKLLEAVDKVATDHSKGRSEVVLLGLHNLLQVLNEDPDFVGYWVGVDNNGEREVRRQRPAMLDDRTWLRTQNPDVEILQTTPTAYWLKD